MAHGKTATHLYFDQQASYLKQLATLGLRLKLRLPAQLGEVVAVPPWLDQLGKRHSS